MELLYKDISYQINGLCYKAHNQLGRFGRERQYADALEILFKKDGVAYKREYEVPFIVEGKIVKGNRADFLVDDKIILELKAKPIITRDDYFQVQRYLSASGLHLGIIVNFGNVYLRPKRVLNTLLFNSIVSVDSDVHP